MQSTEEDSLYFLNVHVLVHVTYNIVFVYTLAYNLLG